MWYALAILALLVLPFVVSRAPALVSAWWLDVRRCYVGARDLLTTGWKAGNSSWWHMLAAGVLLGVLVSNGPALWRIVGPLVPDVPSITTPETPAKVTKVVYVYEKDQGGIPSGVLVALDKLNRQSIVATTHDQNTTDGGGDVPEQYKIAVPEAIKAGLPALVVQTGDVVLRVVKGPTTEAAVMEAAK